MIINVAEVLWPRLQLMLVAFAEKLCTVDPTLIRNVGHTTNDVFLLRGYLTFSRHAQGDEVAITVDIRGGGQQMMIESDACTGDGRVIAAGPTAEVFLMESRSNVEKVIGDWLHEFERFLGENEQAVATAIAHLT